MVCAMPYMYLQNKFGDPRFFYVFNLIFHFLPAVKVLTKSVRGKFLGANVLNAYGDLITNFFWLNGFKTTWPWCSADTLNT